MYILIVAAALVAAFPLTPWDALAQQPASTAVVARLVSPGTYAENGVWGMFNFTMEIRGVGGGHVQGQWTGVNTRIGHHWNSGVRQFDVPLKADGTFDVPTSSYGSAFMGLHRCGNGICGVLDSKAQRGRTPVTLVPSR
jgi:hypothetical protein